MALNAEEKKRIEQVKKFIDGKRPGHISITELARKNYIGRSKLVEDFKEAEGMGLYAYLRTKELTEAANLLLRTEENIKAIAFKTGYKHTSNFSRAFKKAFGYSPLRYRKDFF